MKINAHVCLLVVFFAALPAMSADASDTLLIDLGDLTIEIPSSWERIEMDDLLLVVKGPQEDMLDPFSENIVLEVYSLSSWTTLDAFFPGYLEGAQKGSNLLEQGELDIGQDRAMWCLLEPKEAPPGTPLVVADYIIVRGDKCYIASCTVEADQFEKHKPQFEAIIRTIAFKYPVPSSFPAKGEDKHREAFDDGKIVAPYIFYAMLAAIVIWSVVALFRRFVFKSKPSMELGPQISNYPDQYSGEPVTASLNPYQPPIADSKQAGAVGQIRVEGKYLVVPSEAILPPFCVRTNESVSPDDFVERRLSWCSPFVGLLILISRMLLIVVYFFSRKQCVITFGLAPAVKRKYRNRRLFKKLTTLVLFFALIPAGGFDSMLIVLTVLFLFLVSFASLFAGNCPLAIVKHCRGEFWISGCSQEYLSRYLS